MASCCLLSARGAQLLCTCKCQGLMFSCCIVTFFFSLPLWCMACIFTLHPISVFFSLHNIYFVVWLWWGESYPLQLWEHSDSSDHKSNPPLLLHLTSILTFLSAGRADWDTAVFFILCNTNTQPATACCCSNFCPSLPAPDMCLCSSFTTQSLRNAGGLRPL